MLPHQFGHEREQPRLLGRGVDRLLLTGILSEVIQDRPRIESGVAPLHVGGGIGHHGNLQQLETAGEIKRRVEAGAVEFDSFKKAAHMHGHQGVVEHRLIIAGRRIAQIGEAPVGDVGGTAELPVNRCLAHRGTSLGQGA